MRKYPTLYNFLITLLLVTSVGCRSTKTEVLLPGDLLFQATCQSEFCDAIALSTSSHSGVDFVHVGIFAIIDGDSAVIEATTERGVAITPLQDFITSGELIDGRPGIVAMRIKSRRVSTDDAIARALTYIGRPYDWAFDAANDSLYCSELVQFSYLSPDGSHVFDSVPMNFAAPDGSMPEFWTDLFARLGKPIPQGQPGTNPNSIYKSPALKCVKKYF